jgi:hypothetical protein
MAKVQIEKPEKQERPQIDHPQGRIVRRKRTDPDFDTVFEEEDGDPLAGVDYDENDLEASADREMTELVRQIKADKQAKHERFRIGRDPDYYVLVCFQSRDQRNEFLQKSGWAPENTQFVNGLDVCRRLGVDVKPIPLEPLPQRGKPHKYSREEVL